MLKFYPLKPKAEGFATALSKCYAGNLFATAVYKKTYIREQINDMIVLSQSPPLKPKAEGFATALIKCCAMSDATSVVYKKSVHERVPTLI